MNDPFVASQRFPRDPGKEQEKTGIRISGVDIKYIFHFSQ